MDMPEMSDLARTQFEELHAVGMAAKTANNHQEALQYFLYADEVAATAGDSRKRLDALNPAARALWTMGQYDFASKKLFEARDIAKELELIDEEGIIYSNLGRIAAVRTIKNVSVSTQPQVLRRQSVPYFKEAYRRLYNHPHLYFRYANATHGSIVSALASDRQFTRRLIQEGITVSDQISLPYDEKTPAEINPNGKKQLKMARFLLALGNRTPILAAKARNELIR